MVKFGLGLIKILTLNAEGLKDLAEGTKEAAEGAGEATGGTLLFLVSKSKGRALATTAEGVAKVVKGLYFPSKILERVYSSIDKGHPEKFPGIRYLRRLLSDIVEENVVEYVGEIKLDIDRNYSKKCYTIAIFDPYCFYFSKSGVFVGYCYKAKTENNGVIIKSGLYLPNDTPIEETKMIIKGSIVSIIRKDRKYIVVSDCFLYGYVLKACTKYRGLGMIKKAFEMYSDRFQLDRKVYIIISGRNYCIDTLLIFGKSPVNLNDAINFIRSILGES